MSKCFNVKTKKGFTILEVMIAIFLIIIGIAGVFTLMTKILGQMAVSSSQLTAAYLTQEGIEIVRNIRDTNWLEQIDHDNDWNEGLTDCSTGCTADYTYTASEDPNLSAILAANFLKIDANGFYNYTSGTDTKFKRKVTIVLDNPNCGAGTLKVKVETTWSEKGKDYSYLAQECLYNWR